MAQAAPSPASVDDRQTLRIQNEKIPARTIDLSICRHRCRGLRCPDHRSPDCGHCRGGENSCREEGQSDQSLMSSEESQAPAGDTSLEGTTATPLAPVAVLGELEYPLTPAPAPEDTPTPTNTATASAVPAAESPTPAPPSATPSATATVPPAPAPDFPETLIALLNQIRTDRGLSTLRIVPALAQAAQGYAIYMAENNYSNQYFSHIGLDGSTPNSRMIAAGYTAGCKGEAISAGQATPEAALSGWLASPAHAAILLNPDASDIGVGYFFKAGTYFGHYWVLDTGPAAFPCP